MDGRQRRIAFILSFPLIAAMLITGCGGGGGSAPTAIPASPNPAASSAPTMQSELPRSADAFVDSVGINIHLGDFAAYSANFAPVASLLHGLGIRHVRDGITLGQPTICSEDQQLAASGIHVDYITAVSMTVSDVPAFAACAGSSIESLEGPNEYDISHPAADTQWVTTLQAFQKSIYAGVKAQLPYPVIAPALTSESAYAQLGDISASADGGNMHDYFAGRNPETPGWGASDAFGTYGALSWSIAIARQSTGTKPMYATETGYADGAGVQAAIPAATKARYTVRTLLEHWNAGVTRTYIYELLDEGGGTFGSFGLVDGTLTPKPAYNALKGLLAHLADPGPAFAPVALTYALDAPSAVHHTLFAKRDGSYVLALWLADEEWNPDTSAPSSVTPVTATLHFRTSPAALSTTAFHDASFVTPSTTAVAAATTATVGTDDGVTLVDIRP